MTRRSIATPCQNCKTANPYFYQGAPVLGLNTVEAALAGEANRLIAQFKQSTPLLNYQVEQFATALEALHGVAAELAPTVATALRCRLIALRNRIHVSPLTLPAAMQVA